MLLHSLRSTLTHAPSTPSRGLRAGLVLASLAALTTAAASCSSEPSSAGSGSGGDATSTTTTTTSSSTGAGPGSGGGSASCDPVTGCKPDAKESMEAPIAVQSVEATILDTDGAPVVEQPVFACGVDICPPPKTTGDDGHVLLAIGGQMLKQPALKYGDGLLYGRFAAPITTPMSVFDKAITPKLPATGAPMEAGKQAESGGVTLALEADTVIEIDTVTYDSCEAQAFRAASIPLDKAPAGLDPALKLEILYAAAPVDTFFCPPAKVTIPNTPKWPANTAVEFFIHGLSVGQELAPYAAWSKISDGEVSADGMTITTSAAGGLPVLSAFGVRKK